MASSIGGQQMDDHPETKGSVRGNCLCKALEIEIDLPTLFCGHCHCSMCRKNHGTGYVTWFGVPQSQFRVLKGETAVERYKSSEAVYRCFCRHCGSIMFSHDISTEGSTNCHIPLGVMDGPIDRAPDGHHFFSDRVGWLPIDESLPNSG